MKQITLCLLVVVSSAITGCANLTSPARDHSLSNPGVHWIDYDASRRGTFISVDKNGTYRGCAEPAPDIGLSMTTKLSASLTGADQSKTDASAEFAATALALAGRTQLVLVLRESLFRICEASLNMNFGPDQTRQLFESTLNAVTEIAKAEVAEATARKNTTETKKLEAQMRERVQPR